MKRLAATFAALSLIASTSAQARPDQGGAGLADARAGADGRPGAREVRARPARGALEAPGSRAAGPQHRHARGAHRPQPDDRDASPPEPRARQRRQAARDLRDHHASRLLSGLGECHGGGRGRQGRLRRAKIGPDQLPAASPQLRFRSTQAARRSARGASGEQFGAVFPAMVQNTTDVLFRDLWLRPDLAPRDRSLVTVSALIANGQVRAARLTPQQGDGQRPHAGGGRRGARAPRLLRRLAERLLGDAGRKGRVREAATALQSACVSFSTRRESVARRTGLFPSRTTITKSRPPLPERSPRCSR